jgi:hypothetical protein
MKTLLVITPHSILDVITNSSTELFICDTNKTIEVVKEILSANPEIDGYSEPWVFSIKEYREWRDKKREAKKQGKDLRKFYENNYNRISGWVFDDEDEENLEYLRKHYINIGNVSNDFWHVEHNHPFSERILEASERAINEYKLHKGDKAKDDEIWKIRFNAKQEEIQKIYDEIKACEVKPDWWINPIKYYYNTQPIRDLDGKILILSKSDNSISYESCEWIIDTFNASLHRLG